jgi:hypothetical protein
MGKQVLRRLLLGGGLILGLACSAGQAEVITRVSPDGRVRYIVVHTIPTLAESGAKIAYPSAAGMAAVRETLRTGAETPITTHREEDGRITYTMPTGDPFSQGSVSCGVIGNPQTREETTAAYETVLARLQAKPDSVECRLQLVRIGRVRGQSELAISNDLRVLGVPGVETTP